MSVQHSKTLKNNFKYEVSSLVQLVDKICKTKQNMSKKSGLSKKNYPGSIIFSRF